MRAKAASGTGLPEAGVRDLQVRPVEVLNPSAGQKTRSCPPCLINIASLRNKKVFGKLASQPSPSGRLINTTPALPHKYHIAQRSGTSSASSKRIYGNTLIYLKYYKSGAQELIYWLIDTNDTNLLRKSVLLWYDVWYECVKKIPQNHFEGLISQKIRMCSFDLSQ